MVSDNKVRELLLQQESDILDFKREPHSFSDERKEAEFIKDILAMANTPREESAYIVIGVDCLKDGSGRKRYCGVLEHPDDNDLQQKMNRARVDPRPKFVYQRIVVDGISYGIIEIFPQREGPYVATKSLSGIVAHQIYFRAGTQNKEATTNEERHIWKWFLQKPVLEPLLPEALLVGEPIPSWPEFLQACYGFKKDRLYLFLLGPDADNHITEEQWKFLGQLPLSLVFDFDPATKQKGAYRYAGPVLENQRAVHLRTYDDDHKFAPEQACCWYAAQGLIGNSDSMTEADWNQWNRKYSKYIRRLIEDYQTAPESRFLTVVCLWDAQKYVDVICTIIDENFGDNANYVFATTKIDKIRDIAEKFNSVVLPMPLSNILTGIPHYLVLPDLKASEVMTLPKIHDQEYLLSQQQLHQLSEDLEIVHSSIELEDPSESRTIGRDFLRGMVVSWSDLIEHYDAERDQTDSIVDMIKGQLNLRTTIRLNLYHWPGSGGTTVGHQLAWKMRKNFPTVLLKRITRKVTIGRFRFLFEATELPIFTIYEAADIEQDLVETLFTEARESNIPIVFLAVVRSTMLSTSLRKPPSERSKFIGQHLSGSEAFQFANAYKRVVPEKSEALDELRRSDRTPFWFALTAFEKEFVGITPYVERRIELATALQRDLLAFLALAHYYGHKPVQLDIFAEYIGLHYRLHREMLFRQPALLELLVDEGNNMCRPAHYLIAEQILQIVIAGSGDRRKWLAGLSEWAKLFIKVCSEGKLEANDELIKLLRSLFIRRNEHVPEAETQQTARFSPLMEDIRKNNPESLETVFKELVHYFPSIAHFRGHLARFYSIQGQHQLAFEEMEKALVIAPKDPFLHHMNGMCYLRQATSMMGALKNQQQSKQGSVSLHQPIYSEADLQIVVADAKRAFDDTLNLALGAGANFGQTIEYAYTSQIQLILDVLDFGYTISGARTRTEFIVSPVASWYQEQLDDVEYLMDQVKSLREGDKLGNSILARQRELNDIYDDHSVALQRWDSLVARARTDKQVAVINRQIVVNLLEKARRLQSTKEGREVPRNWSWLDVRDRQRAVERLEENLKGNPASERDIREWFHAVRYLSNIDIASVIEKVANWRAVGDSLEADYYLYILYVLQAIDGNTTRLSSTKSLIKQISMKAFARTTRSSNNTYSFELFGKGQGLARLKHYTDLGEFDQKNFYRDTSRLERVTGMVRYIEDASSGIIELDCGIDTFFVPSRVNPQGLEKGIDEYTKVSLYLGFSYSGLRAWSVWNLDSIGR